jgi:uncharacterized protein
LKLLVIFFIISIAMLLYMRFEAGFLKVAKVLRTKDNQSLKVLHMSDIHINRLKVSSAKIKKVIEAENPDFIVITGDFIEKQEHCERFFKFLNEVYYGIDMYICLGNHDFNAFRNNKDGLGGFMRNIEKTGIHILHNKCMTFIKDRKRINIIGIEDLRAGNPDIKKAFKSADPESVLNIVISHNPDMVFELPEGKADYFLCGHFHGGQIWLPFKLEFKLLRNDRLCRMGIRKGLHKINGVNIYINPGLGNVLFPLRFLSRPEITIYQLPLVSRIDISKFQGKR